MPVDFSSNPLRLGTRGSLLARAQSQRIADELMRRHPGLHVELHLIRTSGDKIQDRPLADAGGKGLFVKELEQALLAGQVDFAVHSCKDLPVTMPVVDESGLVIAAIPPREEVRDAAVMRDPARGPLPAGARVGTASLRRRCQVFEAIPDATVQLLRGNIDTRLRKLREGQYDIILLAVAGLKRANLFDPTCMRLLDVERFLPAPAQGALALQCRRDDAKTRLLLEGLNDQHSARCVAAEQSLVARLQADCHSPVAVLATLENDHLRLSAAVGARGGQPPLTCASAQGTAHDAEAVVQSVYQQLLSLGAVTRLRQ